MKVFLIMIALILIGCSNKGTSTKAGLYGHWKYRGSSTLPQVFQCVETFKPHQNKECQ